MSIYIGSIYIGSINIGTAIACFICYWLGFIMRWLLWK